MSVVEALQLAQDHGIRLGVKGNHLVLEAAEKPSHEVIETLRTNKVEILALLRPKRPEWVAADWQAFFDERAGIAEYEGEQTREKAEAMAFEACLVEWMNRHPGGTDRHACAGCRKPGSNGSVIVPFGTKPANQSWLHPDCWPVWHQTQRDKARHALAGLGIAPSKHTSRVELAESHTSARATRGPTSESKKEK
jgi:hypothetical protein